MAYEKQTWNTGDIITAEKLNHMEDGIAGGTLVIGGFNYDDNGFSGTSDKTWQEIDNALAAGVKCCIVVCADMGGHSQLIILGTQVINGGEYVITEYNNFTAKTTSANGYPTIDIEAGNDHL